MDKEDRLAELLQLEFGGNDDEGEAERLSRTISNFGEAETTLVGPYSENHSQLFSSLITFWWFHIEMAGQRVDIV